MDDQHLTTVALGRELDVPEVPGTLGRTQSTARTADLVLTGTHVRRVERLHVHILPVSDGKTGLLDGDLTLPTNLIRAEQRKANLLNFSFSSL